ncbi:hypothetical protein NLJ89_g8257 [Agrocybe chaxingu]|uniref:Uncharacterized protein n=1 Tax=Agrocybe chaxingu TaxID=84603 RepID=A0A9W8MU98_9AGAR|nr:hypothetical protein NLJ89_g8257 [Agrocybe chaxingu]
MTYLSDKKYWPDISIVFYPTSPNSTIAPPTDIVSGLLPLIWDNRESASFSQSFMRYIAEIAHTRPLDISLICETLALIFSRDDVLALQIPDPDNEDSTLSFEYIATMELIEEIGTRIQDKYDERKMGISPDNERITGALLSASLLRHQVDVLQNTTVDIICSGLCEFYREITNDLDRLFGVMSIIHIAVAGNFLLKDLQKRLPGDGIVQELKNCMKIELFKVEGARALLEVALANAESGYTKNITEEQAWKIHFPTYAAQNSQ